ncbi:MAG: SLC13 family permease, partial [Acidobacteriota bacterium]
MTFEIGFLFAVLIAMVYLFLTEKLPVELTAFLGLVVLIFTGYVAPDDAFVGFSSPAVITMFSIFFISGALLRTGVADVVGKRMSRMSGGKEVPLIIILMLVAGVMSAFMNNVAAAAVLLPAVSSVARHSGISPSRLFMPLSFGAILGGTTTLVGTPPNILTAEVILNQGLEPFQLFDFTPVGLALLGVGILFMTTIGRKLIPERIEAKVADRSSHLSSAYRISERLTSIRVPQGSSLDGQTLRETRLGTALGAAVVGVRRGEKRILAPGPDFRLQADDMVVVDGTFEDLQSLLAVQGVAVQEANSGQLDTIAASVEVLVVRLPAGSGLIGRSLRQLHFRDRFGVLVVGIRRGRDLVRQELARRVLQQSDELLVLATSEQRAVLSDQKGLQIVDAMSIRDALSEQLF